MVLPLSRLVASMPHDLLSDRFALWSALRAGLATLAPQDLQGMVVVVSLTSVVATIAYVLALAVAWRTRVCGVYVDLVFFFATAFFLTSVLTFPNNSRDLFSYIAQLRVLGIYGANPYATSPASFGHDQYLAYSDWPTETMPYGPVWTFLATGWERLFMGDLARDILALRSLLFFFNTASAYLIWRIAAVTRRSQSLFALVLYAWNPIVVLKGQIHVEPMMVFFMLLGIYLHLCDRWWPALTAWTFSALVTLLLRSSLRISAACGSVGRSERGSLPLVVSAVSRLHCSRHSGMAGVWCPG